MTDDRKDVVAAGPVARPSPEPPRSLKVLADATRAQETGDGSGWVCVTIRAIGDADDRRADGDDSDGSDSDALSPVQAIARASLDAALTADLRARLAASAPIVVVVSVPGPDWVDEIRMAFTDLTGRHKAVARDGSQRRDHVPGKGNLDVGAWLAGGMHVVGISQAPATFLPSALIAAADATVDVRAPDGATLARILALSGRKPPPDIPDAVCSGMTFAEIFAAFRLGLDGGGVVDSLARMRTRKAGIDADDGVPPLPDLPGHSGDARAWGTALIAEFAEWRDGTRAWRDVSASAVLAGPPGTGKTVFARSLAKALGIQLISTGVGDWFARTEGNLGDIAVAFQTAWDRAMAARPCLFLLDELDAIPDRATLTARGKEWWTPIVTLILTTTDGAQTVRDGLVLIGATNHGDRMDSALVRRGRFDRIIDVALPTAPDLAAIVAHHLGGLLAPADLLPVVRLAHGASAADAAAWAREARSSARAAGRAVSVADVGSAVAPPDDRSPDDLRRCAIHEAGHAIVGRRLGARVEFASVVQVGASAGRTATDHDVGLATMANLDQLAMVNLGGRAAEEALLGAPSAGAVGDLAKVTALLAAAHASFGLGDSLVHRASTEDAFLLLHADPLLRRTVDAHIGRLYADALAIMDAERDALLRIADALVARRFLTGEEIDALARGDRIGGAP